MSRISNTPAPVPQIKPAALRGFHKRLAHWYAKHGRHDLPWRSTSDPYHIWLSEVMLQQTQVETVRHRFYAPFLIQFPTIEALASAPREAVLKAWEGLGYYSRARNLHAASQQLVSEGGLSPFVSPTHPQLEHLLNLPGIGRNTASAILAFAYHQPVAILEANVKRVVARVFAWESPSDAQLWAGAEALLNRAAPFNYNQAMMDVGSQVCTSKNPQCSTCPLTDICAGKTNPTFYPTPKQTKRIPSREVIIEVREDARGRLFLEPREERLLGGLYGFPQVTCHHPLTAAHALGTVTHTYSHFKLIGEVRHIRLKTTANSPHWHTRDAIAALPLSILDRKVLAMVELRHSDQKKAPKARSKHRPR